MSRYSIFLKNEHPKNIDPQRERDRLVLSSRKCQFEFRLEEQGVVMMWMIWIGFMANLGLKYCSIQTKISRIYHKGCNLVLKYCSIKLKLQGLSQRIGVIRSWSLCLGQCHPLVVGLSPPRFGLFVPRKFRCQQEGLGAARFAALALQDSQPQTPEGLWSFFGIYLHG